jgi:3-oxoacyl-[acyl-carrier-protein] synthase III
MTAQISTTTGGPYARIVGFGSYRPSRVVPNSELVERIDSSDEWIQERSGIVSRRWAEPSESVIDMATTAAQRALADAHITGDQIGAIIISTVSHLLITPSAAAMVAGRIGSNGAAFDISAACAGFSYGINIADGLVRAGSAKYVLVIGAEKLTDFTDLDDRGTAFLFADGAGAAIVGPSDVPGIGPAVWGSDGSQAEVIISTPPRSVRTDTAGETVRPVITMQGQTVFRWAVAEMAKAAAEAVSAAGITPEDLDCFIPHQANNRITDAMIKYLGLPESVTVARDISHMGNTSAASIPLAMDALRAEGKLPAGGLALLIGFGAGLVWSAQVVRIPG